jgi:hypothetical protein
MLGKLFVKRNRTEKSGLQEIIKIYDIIDKKRPPIRYALSGLHLFRWFAKPSGMPVEINAVALSPVDAAVKKSIQCLDALNADKSIGRGITAPEENLTAIAMRIDIGETESILFGSDLEASSTYGWALVVSDTRFQQKKAFMYKVAHHGAESGHDTNKWSNLLHPTPFAFVTPFGGGRHALPTSGDQTRLKSYTPNGYITSDPMKRPPDRRRAAAVDRTLKERGIHMEPVESLPGHIRFRFRPGDTSSRRVDEFEGAYGLK